MRDRSCSRMFEAGGETEDEWLDLVADEFETVLDFVRIEGEEEEEEEDGGEGFWSWVGRKWPMKANIFPSNVPVKF